MRKRAADYVLRKRTEAISKRHRDGIIRYIWSKMPKAIVRIIEQGGRK